MAEKAEKVEKTLNERFVAAWGDMKNPELDGENPHFHNKYATLKSTLGVIREACAKHGIAYVQTLTPADGGYVLVSSVVAGDGESMSRSVFPVETPPNPQTFGSGLTYAKRQQAQADWGITGEPDDDANAAAGDADSISASRRGGGAAKPKKPGKWDEFKRLKAEAVALGVRDESIKEWMDATFKEDLRSYTPGDINLCEAHVRQLIEDKRKIDAQAPSGDAVGGDLPDGIRETQGIE